jgi:ferric-dicitrate binding protein FerR (iron transport regulator)
MRLPVVVTTAEGDITVGESDWVVRDSEDSVRVVAHGSFVENFKEVLS